MGSYTLSRICSTASWAEERDKIQTRFEAFFLAGYPLLLTKEVTAWSLSSTQKKAYERVQDLPWHRGCHQVILCQRENISSQSCFTVGYCWGGHESVICWLSYKAVLEIDDVYVITSELIGSPQASVELSRSEWINEAIPHAIWGSIFSCGFFKYVKSVFKYFHFLCVGLCFIFVLFIIKAI